MANFNFSEFFLANDVNQTNINWKEIIILKNKFNGTFSILFKNSLLIERHFHFLSTSHSNYPICLDSTDFNLTDAEDIFLKMIKGIIPFEIHFQWSLEEDTYLFHLLLQNAINGREISFYSRSKNSCISRLNSLLLANKKIISSNIVFSK